MTFLLTTWRTAMERYRDEGEWNYPCTPAESGLMTALVFAFHIAPVLAFLYFLFF